MKAGARLQAVIEIIDQYDPNLGPLDEYTKTYFRQRRYIGSHDRRQICDDLFQIYRAFPYLQKVLKHAGLDEVNGRTIVLAYVQVLKHKDPADLFTGQQYHPAAVSVHEVQCLTQLSPISVSHDYPDWLYERLSTVFKGEVGEELIALNQQAAVDLCVNTNIVSRAEVLENLPEGEPTPYSPLGIRLQKRVDLKQLDLFKHRVIDIQDEGAQLISLLCDIKPGMTVCDYCAGAGGKTRTLSIMLENQGTIIATDQSRERLKKLQARLRPEFYPNVAVRALSEVHQLFDRVLLDVPCSGIGRLRRQPELKISLSPQQLDHYIATQQQILNDGAELVKPGGYLIYATCSLLQEENEQQIDWFLHNHPEYKLIPVGSVLSKVLGRSLSGCEVYLRLTPYRHGTDGFFAAVLARG